MSLRGSLREGSGDDAAPVFKLEIEGTDLGVDLTQHVKSIEFESAVDMADLLRITVDNPGWNVGEALDTLSESNATDLGAHKAFQPGNEARLYIGHGSADAPENFIGAAHLSKHIPDFPQTGIPTLEIVGYDRSHLMMNASGKVLSGTPPTLAEPRPVDDADDQGQSFENTRHSDVVAAIATQHGFGLDIDATDKAVDVILKKGMSHFELCKGLANLNNRDMWVDYDLTSKKWVLHWKEPNKEDAPGFEFRYGAGNESSLLAFRPEYGLRDTISEAVIHIYDGETQQWVSAIEIEEFEGPDPIFRAGGGSQAEATRVPRARRGGAGRGPSDRTVARARSEGRRASTEIDEALENATAFRIAAGGVAIDIVPPGKRFTSAEDAARFLRRWFLARRDSFIIGHGTVVGTESLRARQVHLLTGLGARMSGKWYFTVARHMLREGTPYLCEFTAHKVMEK